MPFPPTPSNTPSNTPTPSITPSLTPTYTPTNTSCPAEQFAGVQLYDCEGASMTGVSANVITNFGTYIVSGNSVNPNTIASCFPTFYPYLGARYSVELQIPSGYEICDNPQGIYNKIEFLVNQYLGDFEGLGEAWSGITYHYLNDVLVYSDPELVIQTNTGALLACQTLLLPAGEGTVFTFSLKRSPTPTPTATPTNTPTMPVTMTPTPSITASNTPSSTPPVLCNTNWTVRNADCGFGSVNDIGINGSFMGTLSGPSTFPLTSTLYGTKSNPNGVICGTGNTIQANVTTNLPGSGNCAYMEIIINSVQQHILYFTTNPFPTISGVTIANGDTVEVRIGCIAGPCPS